MSKTLRLLTNARLELTRIGEAPQIIEAYIDVLRNLLTIENQTEEEKLSIVRALIYGDKMQDPIEEEKFADRDTLRTSDACKLCLPTRNGSGVLYCARHTKLPEVWANYSDEVFDRLIGGSGGLPSVTVKCLIALRDTETDAILCGAEPLKTEPFCDCCGPGYHYGDKGCNHTPTKIPSEPEFTPDFIFIGNECFAMGDRSYISYKGEQYYRACNHFVADRVDGGVEFCVKRVGHPGSDHESYSGIVLHTIKENI